MSPFSAVRFRGTWRPYQARVLAALDAHLADDRVHLVAPPGSGKTLLGLETVIRMERPALVLVPTLALRDQWLDRFRTLFDGELRTSTDPEAPGDLTVATYQGLHVAARDRLDGLLARLTEAGVGTLVVDEAHHLRNAWWRSLRAVREGLGDAHVVALTATPPYDVPPAEWARYAAFCGPPDADISIPELVRAGHLCPHRDLVRYALPAPGEQSRLEAVRQDTKHLIGEILADEAWIEAASAHPWIADPGAHADAILDEDPEWFIAALALLAEAGAVDLAPHASVLGLHVDEIPALRTSRLDVYLTGALGRHADALGAHLPEHALRDLQRRLDRLGVLDGSRVVLQHPASVRTALAASASKLDAAVEAVRVEHVARGERLRAVVLADRIRASAWDPGRGGAVLDTLGVAPLFERLREAGFDRLGVLTGRVVVVPEGALPLLADACARRGLALPRAESLASGYVRFEVGEAGLVQPVTDLFTSGAIRVLVGTVALLGEGWDAPAANVLVSASAAATFVRTGQIRGRVFRTDPVQPDKVSSIWHLAVVDASGDGVDPLRRRFRAFVQPRPGDPPTLETGLGPAPAPTPESIRRANTATDRLAADHATTRALWGRAVGEGVNGGALRPVLRVQRVSHAVRLRVPGVPWWRPSIPVGGVAGAGVATGLTGAWVGFGQVAGLSMGILGAALVAWGGGVYLREGLRRRRRDADLGPEGLAARAAGRALLDALQTAGLVRDPDAVVRVEREADGLDVWLDALHDADADAFTVAFAELVGPIRSPRYLLRSEGAVMAVPDALGRHKRYAEALLAAWRREVGPGTVVFTRTPPGRRVLVAARVRTEVAAPMVERVRRWSAPRGG